MTNIQKRKGDRGSTQFPIYGEVRKSALALETIGTVEELNAHLGVVGRIYGIEFIDRVQSVVMELTHQLISGDRRLVDDDITLLEQRIEEINVALRPLTGTLIPSVAPEIHLARAVCRRAERRVVEWCDELSAGVQGINRFHLSVEYLNRLDDYLFVLARKCAHRDDVWMARIVPESK